VEDGAGSGVYEPIQLPDGTASETGEAELKWVTEQEDMRRVKRAWVAFRKQTELETHEEVLAQGRELLGPGWAKTVIEEPGEIVEKRSWMPPFALYTEQAESTWTPVYFNLEEPAAGATVDEMVDIDDNLFA